MLIEDEGWTVKAENEAVFMRIVSRTEKEE